MAADPTLIKGAFAVGESMVGPDLSEYYAVKSALDTSFMKEVTDIFTANEKEAEAMMASFNEISEKFLTDIAAGGTPGSERLYDVSVVEMDNLKAQYKLALENKDKKSQHKIVGKLNRLINQNTQADANLLTAMELVNANEINATATTAPVFAALKKIIDFDNGNPDVTYEYDDDSYLTYRVQTEEYGEVLIKASEIEKLVIPYSHGKVAAFNEMRSDELLSYKNGVKEFNMDEAMYNIKSNIINNKRDFADLANRKWGYMSKSYRQMLQENPDIQASLKGLGDWNKDGEVNDQDFVTAENMATVIDVLTNPNTLHKDKNNKSLFDWQLAQDTFARVLAAELQGKYNDGKTAYIASLTDDDDDDDDDLTGYGKPFYSYKDIKDIGIGSGTFGDFIQVDPNTREATYRSVVDRKNTFQGEMGYYALHPDGTGYVRYKSRKEYLFDLKDGKLEKKANYDDRFVTFDRLLEIEGASKGGSIDLGQL